MRIGFVRSLIALMVCGTSVLCRGDAPDPGTVFPQPAYTAEQFVDFIGLNASPFQTHKVKGEKIVGTKYPQEMFFDLGVRHYRMVPTHALMLPDAPQLARAAFEKYGSRPTMLLNTRITLEQFVQLMKDYGGAQVVDAIEGPNEVNNKFLPQQLNLKYGKKTDEAAGSLFMQEYYKAFKADPQMRDIPVIAFTAIFSDYRLARPCDAFDYNNMHSYQGYRVPSSSLLKNFIRANNMLPPGTVIKPFMPTECGFNIEEDKSNQIKGNGSPKVQALNIPVLLGEYFRHGFVKRTYLFALHNADGYGLLESDQETKRPSYHALQSLIAQLKEANWNPQTKAWEGGQFTPQALLFTVDGAPQTLKSLTLQKQNGEYILLMWNELPNWDSIAKRDIENRPAKVTLKFANPVQNKAQVLRQDDSGAFKPAEELAVEDGALRMDIPSSMIMVRVRPLSVVPVAAAQAPRQFKTEATENSVHLSWQAPAEAADLAGYFIYRNGWCIASLPALAQSFDDRTEWIRPGLGYTYELQAYDRTGNMSARVPQIAQTVPKLPDLVVTSFGPEKQVQPGEAMRFKAKVKNIGEGATPFEVPISASFRINGKMISWFSAPDGLKPGEEREYVADGGPQGNPGWTAAEGTYTLECVMDDIIRIPGERSKNNNFSDQTLVVGAATSGKLRGNSVSPPRQIDLSAEGAEDWVHWGHEGPEGVNRKAGANKISGLTPVGKAKFHSTPGTAFRWTWSDGEPVKTMPTTSSALWINGVGNGYSFTAPAGTSERVLSVYVSGTGGASCTLSASLSDGSAAPYVSSLWTGNSGRGMSSPVPGDFVTVYTMRYRAASEDQNLKVEFKLHADATRFVGQARLSAATLSPAATK